MKCFFQGLLLVALLTFLNIETSGAADWMLRVQTMGRICHVQLATASPIGEDFKGPFPSRKSACQEAANQYDETLSDQSKCWTYGGGTVSGCKIDGVTLPPTKAAKKR
jgi:hypothetical protein